MVSYHMMRRFMAQEIEHLEDEVMDGVPGAEERLTRAQDVFNNTAGALEPEKAPRAVREFMEAVGHAALIGTVADLGNGTYGLRDKKPEFNFSKAFGGLRAGDVGKRIFRVGGSFQIENDEQRDRRLGLR